VSLFHDHVLGGPYASDEVAGISLGRCFQTWKRESDQQHEVVKLFGARQESSGLIMTHAVVADLVHRELRVYPELLRVNDWQQRIAYQEPNLTRSLPRILCTTHLPQSIGWGAIDPYTDRNWTRLFERSDLRIIRRHSPQEMGRAECTDEAILATYADYEDSGNGDHQCLKIAQAVRRTDSRGRSWFIGEIIDPYQALVTPSTLTRLEMRPEEVVAPRPALPDAPPPAERAPAPRPALPDAPVIQQAWLDDRNQPRLIGLYWNGEERGTCLHLREAPEEYEHFMPGVSLLDAPLEQIARLFGDQCLRIANQRQEQKANYADAFTVSRGVHVFSQNILFPAVRFTMQRHKFEVLLVALEVCLPSWTEVANERDRTLYDNPQINEQAILKLIQLPIGNPDRQAGIKALDQAYGRCATVEIVVSCNRNYADVYVDQRFQFGYRMRCQLDPLYRLIRDRFRRDPEQARLVGGRV
jgi:hypothetical protein